MSALGDNIRMAKRIGRDAQKTADANAETLTVLSSEVANLRATIVDLKERLRIAVTDEPNDKLTGQQKPEKGRTS